MSTFRTILFATDLSERAHAVFPIVRALAGEARVVVLDVVEQVLFAPTASAAGHQGGLPVFWPADSPAHRHELQEQLRAHYSAEGLSDVDYEVRDGDSGTVIVRTARTVNADLIALGTHARRGLERVLAGSVAETVLREAHCAVLVHHLPEGEETLIHPEPIRRIIHPTDESIPSEAAFAAACALARGPGVRLRLLHVAPADSHEGDDRNALERLRQRAEAAGLTAAAVDTHIAHGEPVTEILREAGAGAGNVVVMGTRGRTGLSRIVLGSTAQAVLREAPCPTVVVKPAGQPGAH